MLKKIAIVPREAYRATRKIYHAPRRRRSQRAAPAARPRVAPRLPRPRCVTRQAAFLAAYRKTANIAVAAKAARIKPARHYLWLATNPKYWEAFTDLQMQVAEVLQHKAVERTMEGWAEPVLYRGRVCGEIRHWSDRLLLLLLKAWKPEEWK